jgi:hypothetical protein
MGNRTAPEEEIDTAVVRWPPVIIRAGTGNHCQFLIRLVQTCGYGDPVERVTDHRITRRINRDCCIHDRIFRKT